jgi:WD40 repeat protein
MFLLFLRPFHMRSGNVTAHTPADAMQNAHRMWLQVWRTPPREKLVAPMQLHRTYGGCHDTVTDVGWSEDGQWLVVASADITARLFSLHPVPGAQSKPRTIAA